MLGDKAKEIFNERYDDSDDARRRSDAISEIEQLQKENEVLKALKDCVAIACNPPEDCNDPKVLKTYMKACFDLVNKENQK